MRYLLLALIVLTIPACKDSPTQPFTPPDIDGLWNGKDLAGAAYRFTVTYPSMEVILEGGVLDTLACEWDTHTDLTCTGTRGVYALVYDARTARLWLTPPNKDFMVELCEGPTVGICRYNAPLPF